MNGWGFSVIIFDLKKIPETTDQKPTRNSTFNSTIWCRNVSKDRAHRCRFLFQPTIIIVAMNVSRAVGTSVALRVNWLPSTEAVFANFCVKIPVQSKFEEIMNTYLPNLSSSILYPQKTTTNFMANWQTYCKILFSKIRQN